MKFKSFIPAVLALCFVSSSAFAQASDTASAAEKYTGETFSIEPPNGWMLVTGALGEAERKKLPANVQEHYESRNADVLFLNLASQDAVSKGFKDSLNIVTISEAIPLTEELVQELSSVLEQQYTSMFEKFEMETVEVSKLGEMDVLSVKGSYLVLDYKIKMEQILVPSQKDSIVMTCTYDSGKENADQVIETCRKAMRSIVLNAQ